MKEKRFILGLFICNIAAFLKVYGDLTRTFLVTLAQAFGKRNRSTTASLPETETVFVGIHVRRMDYSVWLKNKVNGRLLSKLYFTKAMDYFRSKYRKSAKAGRLIFIMASDDREWCKKMFQGIPDVRFTPRYQTREYDMAIITRCNHSIIRYYWDIVMVNITHSFVHISL